MTFAKLHTALFAGALSLAAVPFAALPASASPVTDAFVANVGANIGFLSQSSQLASENSASPALRSFARSEIAEQVQVAGAFVRLAPSEVASAGDEVATGRSVAVDGLASIKETPEQARPAATLTAANGRQALGPADLDQLRAVKGRALDDLYWQKQLDALSQLESDYRTYIKSGDDPSLVALAKADLPRVMKRLEALTKI